MKTNQLLLIVGFILLQGCALHIDTINPQPETTMHKTGKSIKMEIGNGITDSFLLPEYAGVKKSIVTNWHTSLKNGFNNGFNRYFEINEHPRKTDFILKLTKTELSFNPANVTGYSTTTFLNVDLNYQAVLLDGNNNILKKAEGHVRSDKTINVKGEEKEAVKNTIEKMYVQIADKFFK